MKVIDISAWQENIDWEAVKNAGIEGVIIKLGEGTTLDEMFFEHVNNAVNYGLKYGVYYYAHASSIDEARREAYTVDQWLKTYIRGENPALGIWYDAEDNSMLEGINNVVYPIANFIHTMREIGYNYVGLYSSYNWLINVIDLEPLPKDVPIWSAQYGYFLMFSDWRQLPTATDAVQMADLIWRGVVAWDKGLCARAPHKGYFRHQCEYIVWGTKGKCKKAVNAGPYAGCLRYQVMQKDKFHLTGKPTALMEELVKITPEGGIILDPFVGSGTTAVAAKKQNRNFIGIEKTEVYYNIALNRLKEI